MWLRKVLIFTTLLVSCLSSLQAKAAELDVRTETSELRSFLGFGIENSSFQLDGGLIRGTGAKIDFTHHFGSQLNFQVFLTSGLHGGGGSSVSSNFTGLGGYVYYSVLGSCCQSNKTTLVNGQSVLTETSRMDHLINLGAGVDQYMLYGTSSVYPASGLGISAQYQFQLWNRRWKIEAKQSSLSIGTTKINSTSFAFGFLISL